MKTPKSLQSVAPTSTKMAGVHQRRAAYPTSPDATDTYGGVQRRHSPDIVAHLSFDVQENERSSERSTEKKRQRRFAPVRTASAIMLVLMLVCASSVFVRKVSTRISIDDALAEQSPLDGSLPFAKRSIGVGPILARASDSLAEIREQLFHQRRRRVSLQRSTFKRRLTKVEDLWYIFEVEFSCELLYKYGALGDGGKYICNPHHLQSDCLYYGFGVGNDIEFEKAFGVCEQMHVFDMTPSVVADNDTLTQLRSEIVTFHPIGLAAADGTLKFGNHNVEMRSLDTIRAMLNHTRRTIDVLKLDIEGGEHSVLRALFDEHRCESDSLRIDQLLLEVHLPRNVRAPVLTLSRGEVESMIELVLLLQRCGYRLVAREANLKCAWCFEWVFAHERFLQRARTRGVGDQRDRARAYEHQLLAIDHNQSILMLPTPSTLDDPEVSARALDAVALPRGDDGVLFGDAEPTADFLDSGELLVRRDKAAMRAQSDGDVVLNSSKPFVYDEVDINKRIQLLRNGEHLCAGDDECDRPARRRLLHALQVFSDDIEKQRALIVTIDNDFVKTRSPWREALVLGVTNVEALAVATRTAVAGQCTSPCDRHPLTITTLSSVSNSTFDFIVLDGVGLVGAIVDERANKFGDLSMMRAMYGLLRPGGLLFVSVPLGRHDLLYWPQGGRRYAQSRLPRLLRDFDLIDIVDGGRGEVPRSLLSEGGVLDWDVEAECLFVLKKVWV